MDISTIMQVTGSISLFLLSFRCIHISRTCKLKHLVGEALVTVAIFIIFAAIIRLAVAPAGMITQEQARIINGLSSLPFLLILYVINNDCNFWKKSKDNCNETVVK